MAMESLVAFITKVLQEFLIPVWMSVVYAAPIILFIMGMTFVAVALYVLFFEKPKRRK